MSRLARIGAAFSILTMLAACGFTPLYAEPGVSPALSRISVSVPDTRSGFELRQAKAVNLWLGHPRKLAIPERIGKVDA